MTALIFGVGGQDGHYLRQLLIENDIQVVGVSRSPGDWIQGNVSDYRVVKESIKRYAPDFIFQLAANSTTQHDSLWDNHAAISTGALNILEGVKCFSPNSKVFLAGSGLQFINSALPIDENHGFSSTSAYVVCRNQSVYAARYYRSLGIKAYVGYLFNHESPLRPSRHMAQKVVSYCKTIDRQTTKLEIGNLDVKKEWTFAGDVVNGIWLLMNQDHVFESIIGSGQAYSIEDWIKICFNNIGRDWREYVTVNKNFTPEYQILVSNPNLIKSLGWVPTVDINKLAEMMLKF